MRTNPRLEAVRSLIKRHQFLSALVVVVMLTGMLTGISMWLYIQSGASGLDLSRPGFTNARDGLQQEAETNFESTGTLTTEDIATFKKLYEKQRTVLDSLSAFDDDTISDENLGLVLNGTEPLPAE